MWRVRWDLLIRRLWIVLSVVAVIRWLGLAEGIGNAWLYVCALGVWAVWVSHAPQVPDDEGPYSQASLLEFDRDEHSHR
jgi:hypothetical protein